MFFHVHFIRVCVISSFVSTEQGLLIDLPLRSFPNCIIDNCFAHGSLFSVFSNFWTSTLD